MTATSVPERSTLAHHGSRYSAIQIRYLGSRTTCSNCSCVVGHQKPNIILPQSLPSWLQKQKIHANKHIQGGQCTQHRQRYTQVPNKIGGRSPRKHCQKQAQGDFLGAPINHIHDRNTKRYMYWERQRCPQRRTASPSMRKDRVYDCSCLAHDSSALKAAFFT